MTGPSDKHRERAREVALGILAPLVRLNGCACCCPECVNVTASRLVDFLATAEREGMEAKRARCAEIANQYHECPHDCGDVIRAAILSELTHSPDTPPVVADNTGEGVPPASSPVVYAGRDPWTVHGFNPDEVA